jgi:hypothetical protein
VRRLPKPTHWLRHSNRGQQASLAHEAVEDDSALASIAELRCCGLEDLPPKPGRFTLDAAIRGWLAMTAEKRQAAERYVRIAPKETDTDLRRRLQRERLIEP